MQTRIRIVRSALSLLLALACAIGSAAGQDPDEGKTLEIFEVGDLTLPLRSESLVRIWPLLGADLPGLQHLCFPPGQDEDGDLSMGLYETQDAETRSALMPDALTELIRQWVDPEAWDEDGVTLELHGSRLFVIHAKSVRGKVKDLLSELRGVLAEPYQVEIAIYLDKTGPRPSRGFEALSGALARKKLHDLRAAGGDLLLHSSGATIRPGERLYLGTQQESQVQIGFEAEVAKGAKIVTPKNRALRIGTGLSVQLVQVPGQEGMALFASLEHRSLNAGTKAQPVGSPETYEFERADLVENVTAFSLLLPRRGAFVYAPGGSQVPGLRLLFTFHRNQTASAGRIAILPHDFLSGRHHLDHVHREVEHDTSEDLGTSVLDGDTIAALLRNTHPELAEAHDYRLESRERTLYLSAPKIARKLMQASLADLARERARSYLATLVWEKRPLGSGAKWESHGLPATVPILARKSGAVIRGRTQSFLRGYEAEIADESFVQSPRLNAWFSGLQFQLSLLPMHGDVLAMLETSVTMMLEREQHEAFAVGQGVTERLRGSGRFLKRRIRLQPGIRESLGSGPRIVESPSKTWETRLSLQILELRTSFWTKD